MITGPNALATAEAYLDAGQYAQALTFAGQHLAQFPDDVDALLMVSRAQSGLGRHAESFANAQRAVALAPDHPATWIQLAFSAGDDRRAKTAIDAAWHAIQLNPGDWSANFTFAHIATMYGERVFKGRELRRLQEDAFRHAEVVRQQAPDNPASHVVMGYCLADFNRIGEARQSFQQALRLDPDYADAKGGLSYLELNFGDVAAAAAASAGLLRDDPGFAVAEYNLHASVVQGMRWAVMVGMVAFFLSIQGTRYLVHIEPPVLANVILGTVAVAATIWFVVFVLRFLKRAGSTVRTYIARNRLVVAWAGCFVLVLIGLMVTAFTPVDRMVGTLLLVLPPYLAAAVVWIIITRRLKKQHEILTS